ncbi:MAG: hypoxanthine phosphoribosyltransferase [Ruminococcus sp.]|jgi:hypoxanthine phosphoribosyltransferase|nr:hypoxanthine phosphoribosyltransferase [Ruminococcus sp.]
MHKDVGEILVSESELQEIVKGLAKQIDNDYKDKDWLMVGVLKGSVLFMADLMKAMENDFKIDFVVVSSYADGTESTGRVNVLKDISQSIEGKDLLIVEDIIDSGNTLHFLVKYFYAKGASSVKIVTLFDKPDRRRVDVPVEYVGKVIPDAFIVGYGLDYAEKYRTLPYVGILKPEVYS